jgi:hypothetical protein
MNHLVLFSRRSLRKQLAHALMGQDGKQAFLVHTKSDF